MRTHGRTLILLSLCLAIALALPMHLPASAPKSEPIIATDAAADPPHNITHFLHTAETARYISPQMSVMNFFDTELPFNMTGDGRSYSGQEQFAIQWYMFPPAASSLTVTRIDAIIWMCGEVGTGQPNFAGSLAIFEVTEQNILNLNFNGTLVFSYNIPSNTPLFTYPPATPMVFPLNFIHTFNASATIRFVLTVNPGTSGGGVGSQYTNVTVFWDSYHRFDSRLILRTQNPMTVESVSTLDSAHEPKNSFLDEGNTTMYFSAVVSDPYGGYDIRWVNLTLLAPDGTVVPGLDDAPMVRVSGTSTSPTSVYELAWDYGGMPVGVYSYEVWAVDNSGVTYYYYFDKLTFHPYDEFMADVFAIGIIYRLDVHVNDSLGVPLVGAVVDYEGVRAVSNDTGWASLSVFGNGTLTVRWHGVPVYSSVVNLTGDAVLFVTCDVYYPELRVVDSHSEPLPAATVFFEFPDGELLPVLISDNDGSVGIIEQVPASNISLTVWWRGSLVLESEVAISGNGVVDVPCEVYYMTAVVTDDAGTPIPMSTVVWLDSETHILIDSRFTDATGKAVGRLPAGAYDVEVYWHGNEIGQSLDVVLFADMQVTVIGEVFSVNIIALDARGSPLPDAHIVVRTASDVIVSSLADESGTVHAILPAGGLHIEAYWYGALVNDTAVSLSDDTDLVLDCSVSYLDVFVKTSDGNALTGVEIVVRDSEGDVLGYGLTTNGTVSFRLPDQTVTVEGRLTCEYMMTYIALEESSTVDLVGDTEVTLVFDGYPPSAFSTVLFSLALLGAIICVLAVLSAYLVLRMRRGDKGKSQS
ncbi:MAG: hypothetical protein QXJ32_04850 [Thermoplasmata archaeon]